jgi:hypothetical protein
MGVKDAARVIRLTPSEKRVGSYQPSTLQSALEGLHQDGFLVLENVVDVEHVDHLRQVMAAETSSILQSTERGGQYNQGVNSNILQNPPVHRKDCLFDDVFFNPFVVQIANAYDVDCVGSRVER